MIAIKKSD